jgi:5-methylcytosine-specific restriction endonuclease McrA
MKTISIALTEMSDHELLCEVKRLAEDERDATCRLIASLIELDVRRLYLGEGYSSLFSYCTGALRFSEGSAYNRIEAARIARRFPAVLERLKEGAVTLTTVRLLAPHLTEENHIDLLDAAGRTTRREVEQLIARLHPAPDVPATIRKLPVPASATRNTGAAPDASPGFSDSQHAPAASTALGGAVARNTVAVAVPPLSSREVRHRAVVAPLSPERYRLQVTISGATQAKLRHAQDLLRHAIPDGDPAQILDRALDLLIARLERQKAGMTTGVRDRSAIQRKRKPSRDDRRSTGPTRDHSEATTPESRTRGPGSNSRYIPAAVRREVWKRDGECCSFVGSDRKKCGERAYLEFHHIVPFAAGGEASVQNLAVRCKRHNGHEAERFFGRQKVRTARSEPSGRDCMQLVPARVDTEHVRVGPRDEPG